MLEAARRRGVSRFHHISTCEVYGDLALDSDEAFTEDDPYRPRTPYNASKAGADHAVRGLRRDLRAAGHHHQLLQQLRALPVPREGHPAVRRPRPRRPAPAAVRVDPEPARVAARRSTTAGPSRPCSQRGEVGETYHVGSGRRGAASRRSPTPCSTRSGKPESLKKIVPDRPGHDRRYLLDCTKIRRELGWAPTVAFEEGLADTVALVREHRAWWEPLRDRAPVVGGAWGPPGRLDRPAPTACLVTAHGGSQVTGGDGAARPGPCGTSWPAGSRRPGAAADGETAAADPSPRCRGTFDVPSTDHRPARRRADRAAVLTSRWRLRPDVVIHAGAWTAVDACEADPDRAFAVNALGTRHVAEAARRGRRPPRLRLDRLRLRRHLAPALRRVGRRQSPFGLRPQQARRRAGARSRRVHDRADVVGVRAPTAPTWCKTVLRLAAGDGPAALRRRPAGCPTFTADLAGALVVLGTERLPGIFHVTNQGATSWFGFARAVVGRRRARPRRGWSPSPPPSSTRPAPPPGRPTRSSTTPRCACRPPAAARLARRPRAAGAFPAAHGLNFGLTAACSVSGDPGIQWRPVPESPGDGPCPAADLQDGRRMSRRRGAHVEDGTP